MCFDIPDDEVIVIEVSDKREPEPEKSEYLNDATDASCALRPVRGTSTYTRHIYSF